MKYLDLDHKDLESLKAFWTAKEIQQQPECWRKTLSIVTECQAVSKAFLAPLYSKPNLRIVLTGAGTSAFAGRALAPALSKVLDRRVEAIASTDIVSNPYQYFAEDIPTLVVSFARSGNSPESVAAVDLANQLLTECYHLVLTCNGEGQLYERCRNDAGSLAILMPAETNDKSFAMTSSFSSMMLAAFSVLTCDNDYSKEIESICKQSEALIKEINSSISIIANKNAKRVIYLGSGCLQGLAQESALKLLELTAGNVVAMFDSPLGFRHGPKSIVDNETLVVVFISNNPYTRKYDLDLLAELRRDKIASQVLAITAQQDDTVTDGDFININGMDNASDVELIFPYLIIAQVYAFHHSLKLGNTPDNPCPTGEVNRVVQGVTIHEFN
ncbi:SIS domain-containing protein [Photobacterium gaetbulicola]|uniref:Putative phosphosugar isomerase n=1 Tax=Photobacterium gaetbulicola Gung47 TaxID=658445 RepID=A0A0C5WQ06_9GAMM|nr:MULTISPECIES: SIS domain-containing protein [Photobacterium]AJR08437.1 putative phosphosugar isomerase [Photobacterium gaetbulicola Gung47]PSU12056.1 SIS domain-containing protein [Photobacterium gaetbulicola]WEM43664.1 SIS domain-containing protein [Photobacterium sp. DA100]